MEKGEVDGGRERLMEEGRRRRERSTEARHSYIGTEDATTKPRSPPPASSVLLRQISPTATPQDFKAEILLRS